MTAMPERTLRTELTTAERLIAFAVSVGIFILAYWQQAALLRVVRPHGPGWQLSLVTLVDRGLILLFVCVFVRGIRRARLAAVGLTFHDGRRALRWAALTCLAVGAVLIAVEGVSWLARGRMVLPRLLGVRALDMDLVLAAGVFSPLVEDLVFLGLLYRALRPFLASWVTIPAVAGIFAGAHVLIMYFAGGAGGIPFPVNQLAGGVLFAFLFERTGTLVAPTLVHAAANASIMILPGIYYGMK
ncbi:MAG: CPBP family intramembrane glutamic endopeptidase [Planctomycetota bacterium]